MRWSARYRGARSCRHRYTITASLYSILSWTFSQWSSSCNIYCFQFKIIYKCQWQLERPRSSPIAAHWMSARHTWL